MRSMKVEVTTPGLKGSPVSYEFDSADSNTFKEIWRALEFLIRKRMATNKGLQTFRVVIYVREEEGRTN